MMKTYSILFTLALTVSIASCNSSSDVKKPSTATPGAAVVPPNPLIAELKSAMLTAQEAEKIYLDSDDSGYYVLASPDILTNNGGWAGYGAIEDIDSIKKYGNTASIKSFKKTGTGNGFMIKLLPPSEPHFRWSMSNGANLSAEVRSTVGTNIDVAGSFIYELIINKTATFEFNKDYLDESAFNAYVVSQYVGDKTTVDLNDFNVFKKKFGVAVGGAIYEVIINKYKETEVKVNAEIPALVKTNNKFYSKQGGSIRMSTVKMNYGMAQVTYAELVAAIQPARAVANVQPETLVKGLTKNTVSSEELNTSERNAVRLLNATFKDSKVDL